MEGNIHSTGVVVLPSLEEVVVSHAHVFVSRLVQLRDKVQPHRHLVTSVVALHLGLQSCQQEQQHSTAGLDLHKFGIKKIPTWYLVHI